MLADQAGENTPPENNKCTLFTNMLKNNNNRSDTVLVVSVKVFQSRCDSVMQKKQLWGRIHDKYNFYNSELLKKNCKDLYLLLKNKNYDY